MNLKDLFESLAEKKVEVARVDQAHRARARKRNKAMSDLKHEFEKKARDLQAEFEERTQQYQEDHDDQWDQICKEHDLNPDDNLSMNTISGKIYRVYAPGDPGFDEVNDSREMNCDEMH